MTKRQLIGEIRQFNADVTSQFLSRFDTASLRQYLGHLKVARAHRFRIGLAGRGMTKLRMVS